MVNRFTTIIVALCAMGCGLGFSSEARGQALPDGKGKAEFVHNCTACHRADMVTRVKKTPDEWRKSVDDMAARGSDGTKEDLDNVVLYLDKFYSKDGSTPAAVSTSTATPSPTAAAPSAPLTPAEITLANGTIADGNCLTCHRIETQGAYLAPTLNGVGSRRTAEQVKSSITSPPPTVEATYTQVRLTKVDGTKLTARLVSQDDQQITVIEASGESKAYAKDDLGDFEVIDANPMPSFARRIAPDDLDILVRYLRSLPAADDSATK